MLSGIQHFLFCRRQWALIHIEQQWQENLLTTDGRIMHEHAHDDQFVESRGDILTMRGLRIASRELGFSGQCDIVEFHKTEHGFSLPKREGLWQAYPIEYKHGSPKEGNYDAAQLCAQAMCLEEMLCCTIPEGAIYYGETRHRETVTFTEELRDMVTKAAGEMHALFDRGHTPKVKGGKYCKSCSLEQLCMPKLVKAKRVDTYVEEMLCNNS